MTFRFARIGGLTVLFGALTACGMSEGKFFNKLYTGLCEREFDCNEEMAEENWDDEEECIDDYDSQKDDGLEYFQGCKFDRKAAKDCLAALEDLDCDADGDEMEEFQEDCDITEMWDCGDEGDDDDDDDDDVVPPTGTEPTDSDTDL